MENALLNRYAGKRLAFIGTGVSHNDIIKKLLALGIDVTILDRRLPEQMGDIYGELSSLGASFITGEAYLNTLEGFDLVFRSPGVYYNKPELTSARRRGVVITSEMEEFFALCPCKLFAVTGSDGKTTTTTLISEFLQASGKTVHKGGNIGRALLPIVEEIKPEDCAVVELSSFQLISMTVSPDVAVITNVRPNHLDVHGTMEEYTDAKRNLYLHQPPASKTILNADDPTTLGFADLVRGMPLFFSRRESVENGAFLSDDGYICYSDAGKITKIMLASDIRLPGVHNIENCLAATAAVWGMVEPEFIVEVMRSFGGVEHRIEFVRERNGVKWYNDSIASSPTRVLAGLNSFDRKIIVIAGGYDKKIPFEPLAEPVNRCVKALILMGATADKIEAVVTAYKDYDAEKLPIYRVASMDEAVLTADRISSDGDIVSLSPACASFDFYPNFEARGRHFKSLVASLS